MKTRNRIVLLLVLFCITFGGLLYYGQRHRIALLDSFFSILSDNLKKGIDTTIALKGKVIESHAVDYTFWDEMVAFAERKNNAWARENLDPSLKSFGDNALWVYDKNGVLAYAVNNVDMPAGAQKSLISSEMIAKLFKEERFCHFFITTPAGLMEIRGATIHPTADFERKTLPRGYFFAGLLWGKEYLKDLGGYLNGTVELVSPSEEELVEKARPAFGTISATKKLMGWDALPVMVAHVHVKPSGMLALYDLSKRWIVLSMVFLMMASAVLIFFLILWVYLPLHLIQLSLSKESPIPIRGLQKVKSEFGQVARLVNRFFEQKSELEREIGERRHIETSLKKSEEKYRSTVENIRDIVYSCGVDGRISYITPNAAALGYSTEDVLGHFMMDFIHPDDRLSVMKIFADVIATGNEHPVSCRLLKKNGDFIYIEEVGQILKKEDGTVAGVTGVIRDVTERVEAENRLSKLNQCFLSFTADPLTNINSLVRVVGETLGADCALYNRIDGEMLCTIGGWNTPADFKDVDRAEGHICRDVIREAGDEFFVVRDLLNSRYAKTDPNVAAYKLQTYVGKAIKRGDHYAGSLCVVFGRDFEPSEEEKKIMNIASAAISVEEVRRQAEEEIKRNADIESILNRLLQASLEDRTLNDILQAAVDILTSVPWLPLESKGAIFVIDDEDGSLVMRAEKGLSDAVKKMCGRVRDGKCLCGGAAVHGEVVFVDCVDGRHDFVCEGIVPHGHYCVPILSAEKKVRGVINLYLREGHRRDEREMEFLLMAGNLLSIVIQRKAVEEKIRESEGRYRALFESSRDALMTLEPPMWKFTSGNPACIKLFEAKDEAKFVSAGPWELSPEYQPDGTLSAEKAKKMIDTAMEKGSHFFEWTHKRIGGEAFPATVLLTKMTLEGRSFLQATVRDVTEQRRIEERSRQLAAIVESSDDAIIGKTLGGIITSWNAGAEKMYGYNEKEALGKSITILVPPELQNEMSEIFEKIRRGEHVVHYDTVRKKKDGGLINISLSISPVTAADGKIIGASTIARDITERKKGEEELKKAKARLEQWSEKLEVTVRERTEELKHSQEKLMRTEKLAFVGQLASSVSHELRSPLTAIKNTVYLLKLRGIADQNPENADALAVINNQVDSCVRIVSDVLEFVRNKEPVKKETRLEDVIKESLSLTILPENIHVETDARGDLPSVVVDPVQLRQVFDNMIKNAAQAMEGGGTLTIRVSVEGDVSVTEFRDTGVGIPAQNLPKIFDPLFSTFPRGTGLGLPVCQRIVEAHGGTIEVESEVGKGTVFRIKLPVK